MRTRPEPRAGSDAYTDERLMERVRGGDGRAFEALFERYRSRLLGFLARRCGGAAAAEDLFQETWLRVVRGRARFDPQRRFSTWLFQIANNLCRDSARRREVETRGRRRMSESLGPDLERAATPPLDLRLEMRRRVSELPDRLREVLVLRYYQALSEREIAEIVGIPAGTVKSRLHAAVETLRAGGVEDAG